MTYNDFLKNAQSIFESFPNEQVWSQGGFQPNRQLRNPEAGYCVVIRYDETVTGVIAQFMAKVHAVLPDLLIYNDTNLHTTIGTYGKTDMNSFKPDPVTIRHLAELLKKGINGCSRNIGIEFGKWLYNEEAILISAYPNQELWHLCRNIENTMLENGLSIAMGRIMHITAARFTGSVSFQIFEQFKSMMKSAPVLKNTKPIAIDLAAWSCDGLNFKFTTHQRHTL